MMEEGMEKSLWIVIITIIIINSLLDIVRLKGMKGNVHRKLGHN